MAGYRALRRWVERERRRLEKSGERPTQRYLRRSRLVDSTDPLSLRELIQELTTITVRKGHG